MSAHASFASMVASGAILHDPAIDEWARASIIARRVMTSDQNEEFVIAMFGLADEQGDSATLQRALWLAEILLHDGVGDAFEALLPTEIADPLWAELLERLDAA